MKQTIIMALVMLLSISCKKEKNNDDSILLVSGKWYLETEDGVEVSSCEKKNSFEFKNDGRIIVGSIYYDEGPNCKNLPGIEGTYATSGNHLTIELLGGSTSGTYSIANDILTTNFYNEEKGRNEVTTFDKTPD